MRSVAGVCMLLVFCLPLNALGLSTIDADGLTLSFPRGEEKIVSRMAEKAPGIVSFLQAHGIPVKMPVHVILDEDLDVPEVSVSMIPHREIRIPLKAPGVLEEGYLEQDPWTYFLFKGLCLQGIFSLRSGIPGCLHGVFGEIASPNLINPPWLLEGVCLLLYSQYTGKERRDPYESAILRLPVPTDLAGMSNHPGIWPGYFGYRIYGGPFISWLHERYGWDAIRGFLEIHGAGIIPIEIDLKAAKAFGKSWPELWRTFTRESGLKTGPGRIPPVTGYAGDPLVTWDHSGMTPGPKRVRIRGRQGYRDDAGVLWISEYDRQGVAHLLGYRGTGSGVSLGMRHLWDPGPGGVAISREGSRPAIVCLEKGAGSLRAGVVQKKIIPAPIGTIQLSGPVMDAKGRIAVAAHSKGNWDIWMYDGSWQRITSAESIELDPWWAGDTLVFSSNMNGTFQIHGWDMTQVTRCSTGAFLPRDKAALCLGDDGWSIEPYTAGSAPPARAEALVSPLEEAPILSSLSSRPYSPGPSLFPNFIAPDVYAGLSDLQLGLATWGRDVSGNYGLDAGARYSFAYDYVALRAGARIKEVGIQCARYPFVIDPVLTPKTEESRKEYRLSYSPHAVPWLEASLNMLDFTPLEDYGESDREYFADIGLKQRYENLTTWASLEACSGGRKSLFGGLRWIAGTDIFSVFNLEAGKTWEGYTPGHGSYRIGGDIGEGYFTQRPSRLFPLRGFASNTLEAGKAVSTNVEVFWPLADLQQGYQTLPLFLHRLWLGTFIDSGVCSDTLSRHECLVGAGIELMTSLEIAWGNLSSFKVGISWPMIQPDRLDEKGPLFILQMGRPL